MSGRSRYLVALSFFLFATGLFVTAGLFVFAWITFSAAAFCLIVSFVVSDERA